MESYSNNRNRGESTVWSRGERIWKEKWSIQPVPCVFVYVFGVVHTLLNCRGCVLEGGDSPALAGGLRIDATSIEFGG